MMFSLPMVAIYYLSFTQKKKIITYHAFYIFFLLVYFFTKFSYKIGCSFRLELYSISFYWRWILINSWALWPSLTKSLIKNRNKIILSQVIIWIKHKPPPSQQLLHFTGHNKICHTTSLCHIRHLILNHPCFWPQAQDPHRDLTPALFRSLFSINISNVH